jgi:hypothetical protein
MVLLEEIRGMNLPPNENNLLPNGKELWIRSQIMNNLIIMFRQISIPYLNINNCLDLIRLGSHFYSRG